MPLCGATKKALWTLPPTRKVSGEEGISSVRVEAAPGQMELLKTSSVKVVEDSTVKQASS